MKAALLGALAGAITSVAIVISGGSLGILPNGATDARIHDYLMAHPQIILDLTAKLQDEESRRTDDARQAAVGKLGLKPYFNPRVAFITGPSNAKTTFIEFFDYNCPYCRSSLPAVKKFYEAHKRSAQFAFIEFPIKGKESVTAARAAIAARMQPDKYLTFHFILMSEKDLVTDEIVYADAARAGLDVAKLKADMRDSAIDVAIAAAHSLAAATSIDGTPAFIINGRVHEGGIDKDVIAEMLKQQS